MGAEDFSYYSRAIPGFFWFLGIADAAKGTTAKCSLRLVSVRTKAAVWQKDEEVTLDEHGTADAGDE